MARSLPSLREASSIARGLRPCRSGQGSASTAWRLSLCPSGEAAFGPCSPPLAAARSSCGRDPAARLAAGSLAVAGKPRLWPVFARNHPADLTPASLAGVALYPASRPPPPTRAVSSLAGDARSEPASPGGDARAGAPRPPEPWPLHPRGGWNALRPPLGGRTEIKSPAEAEGHRQRFRQGEGGDKSAQRAKADWAGACGSRAARAAGGNAGPDRAVHAREGNGEAPPADLACSVARAGGSEGGARCAARATGRSPLGKTRQPHAVKEETTTAGPASKTASTQWCRPRPATQSRRCRRRLQPAVVSSSNRSPPTPRAEARAYKDKTSTTEMSTFIAGGGGEPLRTTHLPALSFARSASTWPACVPGFTSGYASSTLPSGPTR